MSEIVDMLFEVVGPLFVGMFLGSMIFVYQYQERFHYQCVEDKENLSDSFNEDMLREVESADEEKICYAAPLED